MEPSTPPTIPDFALTDAAPRWPGVVGTISIIWASLNMICGGCGVLSPILMSFALAPAEEKFGPMPDVMRPGALQIAAAGGGLLWAIVLLVAGIMLTLRKPAARPLHIVYAAGSIVLSIAGTVLAILNQQAIAQWAANNPGSEWAKQSNPTISYIVLAVAIILGLAWPVFCLVWFGLVKRTAADIAGHDAPLS